MDSVLPYFGMLNCMFMLQPLLKHATKSILATSQDVRPGWRESCKDELPFTRLDKSGIPGGISIIQSKSSCALVVAAHTVLLQHSQHSVCLVEPLQGRNS